MNYKRNILNLKYFFFDIYFYFITNLKKRMNWLQKNKNLKWKKKNGKCLRPIFNKKYLNKLKKFNNYLMR